jgi:D-glycero-alpha-D-manno-heptose-7-phosphate kinase
MIISKTPYRISFFGGGSDYPEWYNQLGGEVISSTINKYLYISCRELPNFFNHKYRVVYSKVEEVKKITDIKHKVVRLALLKKKNKK